MAFDPDAALGLPTATAKPVASTKVGFDPDAALGIKPVEPGGLRAATMQVAGSTIKGAGQLAADFIPGVSSDNALIQRGQEIIAANPTAIGGLRDIVDKPGKFVAESVGNAGASLGTMVAMRGIGSAITAAAPLTGVAAPVTAGLGQLISWGGPIAAAALPSYSGIRDTQQEANHEEAGSLTSKLLAAGGAATVGAIEQKFGGEALAGKLMSAAGRKALAEGGKQTLLKTVAKEGTKAAVGEGLEEGLQNPIEQLTGYQNPLTPQSLEQTATGMAMGAVGGGVMGGGMAPIVRQVANATDPRVDEVQAKALAKITGAPVTDVSNGIATLTLEDGATFSVPVNRLTEHFASGGTLEALRPATSPAGLPPAGSPPPSLSDSPTAGEVAPWSQTRTEWTATQPAAPDLEQRHYTSVVEALMNRQPVPDTVLAEYPELTARLTEQNSALAAQADLTPAQRQAETEAMYRDLFDEAQRREEWARLLPDRPVTEQTSALATQTDLTPAQAQAERDAAYRDLFDEALRRDAQRQGLEEGPLPPSTPTPLAVSRLVELEQKAQGVLTPAGGTTSTTLTPLEIAEYQRLKAETSPADAQAIAQYQQDIAARDMILQKRDGAPGLTTQSESGEQTVVPAKPPQALSQTEQKELARLEAATRTPPINPYITDSRPLAIGLSAAPAEVLYAQESGTRNEGGGASRGAQGNEAGPVRVRGAAQSGMAAEGRAASGETVTQLQRAADGQVQGRRQAQITGQEAAPMEPLTAPRLTAALEKEFGKGAITALIRKGKMQIVESPAEIPGGEKLSGDSQRKILGAYRAKQGKIYLAASNLSRASVANVFKHEVVHALLREDATFMARREALLKDFNKLAAKEASVQEAFAKVPTNTPKAVKIEEALAYWVQNPDNHNHSLFKRIVAAVKAALRRLGIPTTAMTATDFSVLIAEGTQRYVSQGSISSSSIASEQQMAASNEGYTDPPENEAQALQQAIEGKSIHEVAKYISESTTNESYKTIARRVQTTLNNLERAGATFSFTVAHIGDSVPSRLINARGLSVTDVKDGINIAVWVNGADVTGKVGVSYETVLHELLHAATQAAMFVGVRKVAQGTAIGKASIDLVNVTNDIIKHFNGRIRAHQRGETALTPFEIRSYQGANNAFANEHEVLAWAFTNKDMQEYLDSVPITSTTTLWSKFVSTVRKLLGLSAAKNSALSEVLRAGEEILNAPAAEVSAMVDTLNGKTTNAYQTTAWQIANEQTLFSQATAAHSAARSNVLANLKEIASEKLTETSPFILRIAPLQTLVQTLGRKIPQIGKLSRQFDEANHVATSIIEDGKGNYDAVKGLTRKDKSLDKFNDAANLSSFYRMAPWKSMDEQDWTPDNAKQSRDNKLKGAEVMWKNAGMDKATGKSFIAAYLEAAKAYNALSPQVQEQYQKMVRHMKHIRDRERTNVLATIEAATANNLALREAMMARFDATFNNISGAYWQLSRTGDYRLEYVDLNGARVVEHFNSRAERRLAVEALVNDGVDPAGVKTGFAEKRTRGQVAIPNELMQQLTQSIVANQTAGLDPNADPDAFAAASQNAQDVINDMNQIWLRWQPETSALKNAVQRRNVKGYSRDALRSYLDYVQRHANSIAWTEQGRKIEDNLTSLAAEIKEERNAGGDVDLKTMVLNDLRARVQAVREANVGAVASTLGRLGTAYYMTSPSIALVQMTQLPILTLPKLGVMYDAPAKAAAALYRGVKASFSSKFSRDALFADDAVNALFNMTRDVVNEGNRDKPEVAGKALGERVFNNARIAQLFKRLTPKQQQLFILREALARNLLDISATHEAYAITQGKNPDAAWRKAFDLAMTPMRLSEQASRKAAILATMEMAQAQGKGYEEIMSDVTEVVNDTLYSYAKTNKPVFMQGGMGRVLGMFQWYRIMTAFRLALLFKRSIVAESPATRTAAQKELIGIMGTTAALAGSLGLPLSNLIFAALDALADDDEPRDSELEFRNLLQQGLGEKFGNIAAYGLPAAVGMHLTRRVGMGDMFGSNATPPPGTAGKDLAAWWAANQLGPAFSIGQSWVQGYDEIVNKGELMRGLETVMPKPLKDGLKALRVATSGELLSPSGKRLLGPEKITPDMVPMLALGFTPVEAAKVSENNMSRAIIGAQLSARRGRLIAEAADALQGDGDIDAAKEAISRFNTKMPAFAIRGGEIRTALIRSIKNERGVVGRREQRINSVYGIPSVE